MFFFSRAQTKSSSEPYKILPMADIRVFGSNPELKSQLLTTLQSGMKSKALFDSDYLEEVDTGDRTALFAYCFNYVENYVSLLNSSKLNIKRSRFCLENCWERNCIVHCMNVFLLSFD